MNSCSFGSDIVVGIDLADNWRNVVAHGAHFAGLCGARLHLVHAVEGPPSALRRLLGAADVDLAMERHREEATRQMEEACAALPSGTPGEWHIIEGAPTKVLLEFAHQVGAGLIVAGAGEAEGTGNFLVGSNIDRIIRTADVPVLVVGEDSPHDLKNIMVPTDLDRADEAALRMGAWIGGSVGATVTCLHVFAKPTLLHRYLGDVAKLRRDLEDDAKKQFETFLNGVTYPDGTQRPTPELIADRDEVDAAKVITREALRRRVDLIVMALGGISILQRFMIGGVAEQVLRSSPCPLLSVPLSWAQKH